jgi:hypothetical protein
MIFNKSILVILYINMEFCTEWKIFTHYHVLYPKLPVQYFPKRFLVTFGIKQVEFTGCVCATTLKFAIR